MRDLSFYKQVGHPKVEYHGHPFNMPVFYYDVTAMMVGFLTPLDKVTALLPSACMKPLRATPWHAVNVIACFEYRNCDAGPYNEVAITFPFTMDRSAPIFTGLLKHIAAGPMAYIYKLPVTTEIARQFGVDFYNFPKLIADIDFSRDGGWIHCHLSESGHSIFTLSSKMLSTKPSGRWRFECFSTRDDRILRSQVTVNVRQQVISRNPKNVKLELGDHNLAEELRNLKLGRMVHLQYLPACQTILSSVVESYEMNEPALSSIKP
jgi:hypothetical protein